MNGTGASTTGNIYGIYDMVGGSWEYQIGWLNTASSTWGATFSSNYAGFSGTPSNHKYYEEYTTTIVSTACGGLSCYGHALGETLDWYGDIYNMLNTDNPWIERAGFFGLYNTTSSGVFTYGRTSGVGGGGYSTGAILA